MKWGQAKDFGALLLVPPAPPGPKRTGPTDLERAAKHHYVIEPGGKWKPGITTIAAMTDRGDTLRNAQARLTAEIAVNEPGRRLDFNSDHEYARWLARAASDRWSDKSNLGTRVHQHANDWANGRSAETLADEQGHLDALQSFIETEVVRFIASEAYVGCPTHGYGGRLDQLGELHSWPGVTLWDWKTGRNRRYAALRDALQLVGLATAEGFIRYDAEGWVSHLEPLPEIHHLLDVYLSEKGTYTVYETPMDDSLVDLVHQLAAAYHGQKRAEKYLRQKGLL